MHKVKPTSFRDITNKRFGSLKVLRPTLLDGKGSQVWKAKCDCGKMTMASWRELNEKNNKLWNRVLALSVI